MSIQSVSSVSPQIQAAATPTPPSVAAVGAGLAVGTATGNTPARGSTPASQTAAPQTNATQSAERQQAVQQNAEPSRAALQEALEEVREAITPVASNLQFSIDDDTGQTVIRIIDSSTDEVIRQIPSEEFIAIAKALDKLQGLLIRQEA